MMMSVHSVTECMLLAVFSVSGAFGICDKMTYLKIQTPKRIEALSGTCLQIPCSLIEPVGFKDSEETFGVWIKNDVRFINFPNNVIFNSSKTNNAYPGEIIGDLNQGNCTTIFSNVLTTYSDKYYFRVENSTFRATDVCKPLFINVNDTPESPNITDPGEPLEGSQVSITCSAGVPCPRSLPELTWSPPRTAENVFVINEDGILTAVSGIKFIASDQHVGVNITCSVNYPVNNGGQKKAENTVVLNVLYPPKDTASYISPSNGKVAFGSQVNLTCSSRANPPVSNYTWFKSSTDGDTKASEGAFYSVNATTDTAYFCVATNIVGNQTSSMIRVYISGSAYSAVGQTIGILAAVVVLISLASFLWWLMTKTSPQNQEVTDMFPKSQTGERGASTAEQDIQYGELDFSRMKPKQQPPPVRGAAPESEYAVVQRKANIP